VFEDGVDVAIGADADGQGARTSGFEPGGAVAAAEAEQAQVGAVALLGTLTVGEDRAHKGRGPRANALGPLDEARRRPLLVVLVGFGHMSGVGGGPAGRVIAPMGGPRCPRWKSSTVVALARTSTTSWMTA
jgi:hypothetical protein